MTKELTLTGGGIALVDDDDYERFCHRKWSLTNNGYAKRKDYIGNYRYKSVYLHRVIMNAPDGVEVDHINGNRLDNRKCNLRLASRSENMANSSKPAGKYSHYKGVGRVKRSQRWAAKIMIKGHQKHLGMFDTEREAAIAYNIAALDLFGSFAKLNEVES